jgi:Capsular polysaccharide synthesis protein
VKLLLLFTLLSLDESEVSFPTSALRARPARPGIPLHVIEGWLLSPNLTAQDSPFAHASQRGDFAKDWWARSQPHLPLPLIPAPLTFWFVWVTPNFSWILYGAVLSAHPSARVRIASNTLPLNKFACLDAFGSVEVVRYSLLDLALELRHDKTLLDFIKNDTISKNHVRPEFRPSHQSDLLRFLLLESHGGVFCDSDLMLLGALPEWLLEAPFAIAMNPTSPNPAEAVALMSEEGTNLASGFMYANKRFTQGRALLHYALERLPAKYDPHKWPCIGPNLINEAVNWNLATKTFLRSKEEEEALLRNEGIMCATCIVELLTSEMVFPLHESLSWMLLHPDTQALDAVWHTLKRHLSYARTGGDQRRTFRWGRGLREGALFSSTFCASSAAYLGPAEWTRARRWRGIAKTFQWALNEMH